jgi:cell wall-associated NlpC family hydrolase
MPAFSLTDLFRARFLRGGRDIGAGLDCQGLFVEVMRRYGHDVSDCDIADYAVERVSAAIRDAAAEPGRWEALSTPEEGCAVLLALDAERPDLPQHLGVTIGGGRFIHILEGRGVLVSSIHDRFWAGKIRGYYRWRG